MTNTKWLEIENTSIFMKEEEVGCLTEWTPIAQVTLRQIYPTIAQKWYAWGLCDETHSVKIFDTKAEACSWVVSKFG